ncbi:MAG TPA: hypothetical protein VGL70_11825 [Candidatus Binatia bacterium]|jgi:hypothetical protein
MYFKMVVFSFLSFLIVLFGVVHADETADEHGHKTPHGGIVREAEGMHVEFLIDKTGQPKLYLYDKAMKPLERTDLETKLTVKGHDGEQHSRGLKAVKDPKEAVVYKGEPIKGASDWDTAVVSLKVKDQWHHIRFSHH